MRPTLRLTSFAFVVMPAVVFFSLGLIVISIWLFAPGEPIITLMIGCFSSAIAVAALVGSFKGTSLVLDRSGFDLRTPRTAGRKRRYEWTMVKSVSPADGTLRSPPVIVVVLHATGFLGLHRRLEIPDFFQIRRVPLSATMEQLRASAERIEAA